MLRSCLLLGLAGMDRHITTAWRIVWKGGDLWGLQPYVPLRAGWISKSLQVTTTPMLPAFSSAIKRKKTLIFHRQLSLPLGRFLFFFNCARLFPKLSSWDGCLNISPASCLQHWHSPGGKLECQWLSQAVNDGQACRKHLLTPTPLTRLFSLAGGTALGFFTL